MKATHGLVLAAVLGAGETPARAAEEDYFRHPPGAEWGAWVGDIVPGSLVAIPGGYVMAGVHFNYDAAAGPLAWGALLRLDEAGTVAASADFRTEPDRNEIHAAVPRYAADGTLTGFAFTGDKIVDSSEDPQAWVAEGLWTGWTGPDLTLVRENVFGRFGALLKGHGLLDEAGETVVCGADDTLETHGGVLARFAADGTKTAEQSLPFAGEIFALAPTGDGGYALATEHGLIKVNRQGETQWHAGQGTERPEVNFYDRYYAVAVADDGSLFAAGQLFNDEPLIVIAHYAPDGSLRWRQTFGARAEPRDGGVDRIVGGKPGALFDVVALPGGGCAAAGEGFGIYGGADLLALKMNADGSEDWTLPLGTEQYESGSVIALAPDGDFLVGGVVRARVDSHDTRTWLVKVRHGLQAPRVAFDILTPLPVFHGQEVRFDSSASTAPDSHIVSRHWDFGDGTELDDEIAPRHTYYSLGVYPVTLTIRNADGIRKSVTHEVEVIGLERQWERYFGESSSDRARGMVAADNGGVTLVGRRASRLWVAKTDARGRSVWERLIGREDDEGEQTGYAIVRAPGGGCVVAGTDYHYAPERGYWVNEAWLLKLDETGEPAWPEIRVFSDAERHCEARCLIATSDGGYLFAGYQTEFGGASNNSPWFVKTDAEGNEQWSIRYDWEFSALVNSVVQAPDGGFVFTTDTGAAPFHVAKLDAEGALVWDREFDRRDRGNWIGLRHPPEAGFAVVGIASYNIGLRLLQPDGAEADVRSWNGSEARRWEDVGCHATPTPDGGFLITGRVRLPKADGRGCNEELALVKTDAEGNTQWVEFVPGTEDIQETGIAAVALDDGSYFVLGSRGLNESPLWLFKLARNLPPVPQFTLDPPAARAGQAVHLDASASTDSDGEVVAWEWRFDDDSEPATGAVIDHVFTESGVREVRLTVVDNEDAERSLTQTVVVEGIQAGDQHMSLDVSEVLPHAKDHPRLFPRQGAAPGFQWENARGFYLEVTATGSTTRPFRITYDTPLPERFTLYQLPDWVKVPYTIIDKYTLEIRLHIDLGTTAFAFVFGPTTPLEPRRLLARPTSNPWLLALHFGTVEGAEYEVESTANPVGPWTPEVYSPDFDRWPNHHTLTGDGENALIYVNRRSEVNARFFRLRIVPPPENP